MSSYIYPNTDIYLLAGVPIDPEFKHSLYFASKEIQSSTLAGYQKKVLRAHSYQRKEKGVLMVGLPEAKLYDCNYMMFKNTSYEDKWFYAFILDAEYVNDVTTRVKYKIDPVQTWMLDWKLHECFIERQHSETDEIGDNIIPETVDLGEMVLNDYNKLKLSDNALTKDMSELCGVLQICHVNEAGAAFFDWEKSWMCQPYSGIPSGTKLFAFELNSDGFQSAVRMMGALVENGTPDELVSIYCVPKFITKGALDLPLDGTDLRPFVSSNLGDFNLFEVVDNIPTVQKTDELDGYKPVNNKLYTYPYNYLQIDDGDANTMSLRYEFFNGTPLFLIRGTFVQPVQCIINPMNYGGVKQSGMFTTPFGVPNLNYGLPLNGYPMGSWTSDSYRAYLGQISLPEKVAFAGAASVGAQGMLDGATDYRQYKATIPQAIGGALFPIVGAIGGAIMRRYRAAHTADRTHGNSNSGAINCTNHMQSYYYGRKSLNHQNAKMIDDFFTMYGYAQSKVALPNIHARKRYTYIKTIGCSVMSQPNGHSIPSEDSLLISQIFDNGITFWSDYVNVGTYSEANPPIK